MAKIVRGRKFTDDEVENLDSGRWDDETIIAVCEADGWEKIGKVGDLKNDFDIDFFDMDQTFYDAVLGA